MRMVANKDYWRGAPKVDEVIFQTYQNQDTMAQDLKTGAIQSGWNIPSAQFNALNNEPDLEAIKAVTIGFDELGFNCADKKIYPKSTGHPGAAGPGLPQRPAVGGRQGQDRLHRLQRQRRSGRHHHDARLLLGRGRLPPHAGPSPYTFDLDKARQALDAAGYPDGERRRHPRVQGQADQAAPVRAHRVSREPELRQAHHRLVPGRSVWTSTTRSSTTARSATSSTTTTATTTRRTSTCSSGAGAGTSTRTSSSRS